MTMPDDPLVRRAMRRMTEAFDRLAQTRADVERTPVPRFDGQRVVDSSMMFGIASLPGASAELKAYAFRVGTGECCWDEIESLCRPVPREVAELKLDPLVIWFPPRRALPPDDDEPYTIPWQ